MTEALIGIHTTAYQKTFLLQSYLVYIKQDSSNVFFRCWNGVRRYLVCKQILLYGASRKCISLFEIKSFHWKKQADTLRNETFYDFHSSSGMEQKKKINSLVALNFISKWKLIYTLTLYNVKIIYNWCMNVLV